MSHALFDALRTLTKSRTDVELAKVIGIQAHHLGEYRVGRQNAGPGLILRIYDNTGMSIERIRELLADKSPKVQSQRAILQSKYEGKKAANLLKELTAKPKRANPAGSKTDESKRERLTVKKTDKWVSTVHRMM